MSRTGKDSEGEDLRAAAKRLSCAWGLEADWTLERLKGIRFEDTRVIWTDKTTAEDLLNGCLALVREFFKDDGPRALEVLKSEDLESLYVRMGVTRAFCARGEPLFSLAELADVLRDYLDLLAAKRDVLVQTGHAAFGFAPFRMLDRLQRTYYVRWPEAVHHDDPMISELDVECYMRRESPGFTDLGLLVRWRVKTQLEYEWLVGELDRIVLLPGLDLQDAAKLERNRAKLFEVKVKVLQECYDALVKGTTEGYWDRCKDILISDISADEATFYLRMDKFYTGQYSGKDGSEESDGPVYIAGGLSDILTFVGYVECELRVGVRAQIRKALGGLVTRRDRWESQRLAAEHYLEFIGRSERTAVDKAIDIFLDKAEEERNFWRDYSLGVNDALKSEFYEDVAVRVRVRQAVAGEFQMAASTLCRSLYTEMEETGRIPGWVISGGPGGEAAQDDENRPNVFKKEGKKGDVWRIRFGGGESFSLKDMKGLAYIRELIKRGDAGVRCLELQQMFTLRNGRGKMLNIDQADVDRTDSGQWAGLQINGGVPASDMEAIRKQRKRLGEIGHELDEASRDNDEATAARLEGERRDILRQLSSDAGVEGIRQLGKYAERSRKSVGAAIGRALGRIKKNDDSLWRHLINAIKTGLTCSYQPDSPRAWDTGDALNDI